jgi:hypothetical protein
MGMPLPLKTEDVANRLRDYSRENYLLLANVIKGVVLGSATVSAVSMAGHPWANWAKFAAFICSGAAAFISYVTWTRGVLLTNSRSNTKDAVLPLVMGGVEVSLFAVLTTGEKFPQPWHFWFFILALHSSLAVLLVRNRIRNTRPEDFVPRLRDLIYEEYRGWMKKDVFGATMGMIMSVVFGLLMLLLWSKTQYGDRIMAWLPFVPCALLIFATQNATRQLQELDRRISTAIPTPNESN